MAIQNRTVREYLKHVGRSMGFWTVAMTLLGLFRYLGLHEEMGISIDPLYAPVYEKLKVLPGYVLGGLLLGLLYATIEFSFEKFLSRRISIALYTLLQAFIIFVAVIFVAELVSSIVLNALNLPLNLERGWWFKNKAFWPVLLYIPVASFVFSLLVIVSDKFGNSVFFRILMGYYKNPKEEDRVFLFIDLKDSTTIAEQVGHVMYSRLIQDCFYDLNEIGPRFGAEIYQYVGDEAILSWSHERAASNLNCLRLFFAFQNKIQEKAEYYEQRYGVVPVFKAGLHGGVITAAEVGVVKKELAYHGDVVNTAARIQGEYNRFGEFILVSEGLLERLDPAPAFSPRFVGKTLLKGKQNEVSVFAVDPSESKD